MLKFTAQEHESLNVFSPSGRVVMSDLKNVQSLPMESLTSGVYFLQFRLQNGQSYMVKVVKQ